MLVFQLVGLATNVVGPLLMLVREVEGTIVLRRRSGSRFAAVVSAAMERSPQIASRKYADRWLVKVLGRGLGRRAPLPHERRAALARVLCTTATVSRAASTLKRLPYKLSRRRLAPAVFTRTQASLTSSDGGAVAMAGVAEACPAQAHQGINTSEDLTYDVQR